MRGFLTKWLQNKSGDKSLVPSQRQEPSIADQLTPQTQQTKHETPENIEDPDTVFLDYEEWSSTTYATQLADSTRQAPTISNNLTLEEQLQDEILIGAVEKVEQKSALSGGRHSSENRSELDGCYSPLDTQNWPSDSSKLNNSSVSKKTLAKVDNCEETSENFDSLKNMLRENESKFIVKAEPSCNLCAKSFREIDATIELVFCPFCGAKQPSEERVASRELGNSNLESGLYNTTLQKTQVREYNLLDDAFLKDGALNRAPQTNVQDLALDGFTNVTSVGSPNDFPIADESRSLQPRKKSLFEDDFSGLDAGFDDDKLVDDLISYMSPAHGHNLLSQNNGFDTGDQFVSKQKRKEDWENFLDEDIEEQIEATDQFFEDGDLLESVKIVEYASRLTSQIIIYKSTDRKKTYDFFIDVLGDFPFYQSYAALERLIAKGLQLDHIQDVYSVKLLWLMNPSIWSNRYYNKMERMWITSTNTRLKNSMSWQLASDLALNHSATDLENLIINDWFALWLNLPIMDGSTASGINPAYRSYSAYLYQSSNHNL